jgi:purine-binding chemotaxis protein CheW
MLDAPQRSSASALERVVEFSVAGVRYALPLTSVARVLRSVEVTPLPHAPDVILGVINLHGHIVPVADIRRRFRLQLRAITVDDKFIIGLTATRKLAVVADEVHGMFEYASEQIAVPGNMANEFRYVAGIVKSRDGVTLIHDLDTFLAAEEERSLQRALDNA